MTGKYEVIEDTDPKRFENRVNKRLAQAWGLIGGVSIQQRVEKDGEDSTKVVTTYAQAIREV